MNNKTLFFKISFAFLVKQIILLNTQIKKHMDNHSTPDHPYAQNYTWNNVKTKKNKAKYGQIETKIGLHDFLIHLYTKHSYVSIEVDVESIRVFLKKGLELHITFGNAVLKIKPWL